MSKRWKIKKRKNFLDIGCGHGGWISQLLTVLAEGSNISLVDISEEYLNKARINLNKIKGYTLSYYLANGTQLPFKDDSFDFVTCHRVLMHIANPSLAIQEMWRVLKPGGIAVILEPCSLARSISSCYRREIEDNREFGMLARFHEIAEKGKKNLSKGDNSIGEEVALLLQQTNFKNISTVINDNVMQLLPNSGDAKQMLYRQEIKEWFKQRFYSIWEEYEAENFFLAGGGTATEFKYYQSLITNLHKKILQRVNENKAHIIINDLIYVSWGYK
ncbi:hypothetical protein IM40_02390 [Candidatus Paracaedimonas acanthamoebae]|nr:hypothetical protein IM40_02390 [Candidatus Paracaedimonas acanthamoebae]